MKILLASVLLIALVTAQDHTMHTYSSGGDVLSCHDNGNKLSGCTLAKDATLDDLANAIKIITKQQSDELKQRVRYDEICSAWGKWHYRKGYSKLDGHGGGSFSPPDRWRICVSPKPIYQDEIRGDSQ